MGSYSISVVIPSYNAASWLPISVPKIIDALHDAKVKNAEIIVIDDGSSDNTSEVVKKIDLGEYKLRYFKQKNAGRFLTRKNGVERAKYENILLIDTRIIIGKSSLKYAIKQSTENKRVWTSHVNINREGNIYARFWEGITFLAWRKYFKNPKETSYGLEAFDHYPKGTTCFLAPKDVLVEANNWFEKTTNNPTASNDDTLLIRRIAEKNLITISPSFFCTYNSRNNIKQYCKHVFHRGKVFVDAFFRLDGNRYFLPLLAILATSIALPVIAVLYYSSIPILLLIAAVIWLGILLGSILLSVPYKDAVSMFLLLPVFTVFYVSGIWNAIVKIISLRMQKVNTVSN